MSERVKTQDGWVWREGWNEICCSASETGESTGGFWCPGMDARDRLWEAMLQELAPTAQELEEQHAL